jgi:ABC-2 type transport system permease protein
MNTTPSAVADRQPRSAGPWSALLAAEVRRVWHRRLFRLTALIILAGSVVVWSIIIVHSLPGTGVSRQNAMGGAVGATILIGAATGYLIGASVGGADWSSRSMTLQLMWEPRRGRLLSAKWAAVLVDVAGLLVVLGLVNVVMAEAAVLIHSDPAAFSDGQSGTIFALSTRGPVIVIIAASFGYLVALLVRNTGAALGVGFGYFLVVENFLTFFLIRFGLEQFSVTANIGAFLTPGGLEIPDQSFSGSTHISSLHGLVELLAIVGATAALAFWSFGRRDVA